MIKKIFLLLFVVTLAGTAEVMAQRSAFMSAPKFRKIENKDMPAFERKYNTNVTGRGLNNHETIDNLPTMELRARLQAAFGNPTRTVLDMIGKPGFREAQYIQFEYWFEVDDSMPLVILDISGPFSTGLVYGGLPRNIDMLPEVKRELSNILMNVPELSEYADYYYALDERDKAKSENIPSGWYLVEYKNGTFKYERTTAPRGNR